MRSLRLRLSDFFSALSIKIDDQATFQYINLYIWIYFQVLLKPDSDF